MLGLILSEISEAIRQVKITFRVMARDVDDYIQDVKKAQHDFNKAMEGYRDVTDIQALDARMHSRPSAQDLRRETWQMKCKAQ